MKRTFNFPWRLWSKIFAARARRAALEKLRGEHPGCAIMNCTLQEVAIGEGVAILRDAYLAHTHIGNYSYVSYESSLVNVHVGNFCSIGPQVQIGLAPHPARVFVSTYPAFYSNSNEGCPNKLREDKIFDDSVPKTMLGHDVWIGSNVIMPGGINVGTGAIVAAGSVLTMNVPPYAIVGGNPAKIIRYRFSEEQIRALLELGWWDWPIKKIRQHLDEFSNIEEFLNVSTRN